MIFDITFGELGIIDWEERDALMFYAGVDLRELPQRKQYNEYYVEAPDKEITMTINQLSCLAESFDLLIRNAHITVRSKE